MCGIAGVHEWRAGGGADAVGAMLRGLLHRGPDDGGTWTGSGGTTVLGHRRLSVIDLSDAAHQPMLSPCGRAALVFNGEIYNYRELRAELAGLGHAFRSSSDTEVLLAGWLTWGEGVLDRLVGMFALALWDARDDSLFLARDRFGEKPLYYAAGPDGFAFASEAGALGSVPGVDLGVDPGALALYLTTGTVPAPLSIYAGIRKLPAAHALRIDAGGMRLRRYWDPVPHATAPRLEITPAEASERLEALLSDAVQSQMLADVPLGAFLSGGYDSSTIVALMRRHATGPVRTFTIGFDDPRHNEAPYAAAVAQHLETEHRAEVLTEADALALIPGLPSMYGEPFADSSALPTHLVSRMARRHVTVALTGDGSDELLGGYARFGWLERLVPVSRAAAPVARWVRPALSRAPGRLGRVAPLLGRAPGELYDRLLAIQQPEAVELQTGSAPPPRPEFARAWAAGLSPRRSAMLADLLNYLPETMLVKVDRAAMRCSLETRTPFLDHRVAEFALRLPDALVRDKRVLRQVAWRHIPRAMLERPKQGFSIPLARWLRTDLRELLADSLTAPRLAAVGIARPEFLLRMLSEHLSGARDRSAPLWTVLMLVLWYESRARPTSRARAASLVHTGS